MNSEDYSKLKEVLTANPEDAQLLKEAGVIDDALLQEIQAATEVTSGLAAKYYDLNKVQQEILDEVAGYDLKDLEFETGRYEISYDFLGSLETALRTFGLQEVGIEETENGYKLGDQEAGSIDELEFAEEVLSEYAEKVADDLNERLSLPGVFYFGFNSDFGDGAYRLFYAFEKSDIPELQELGSPIEMPERDPEVEASFDEIIAELEAEGCHEMAVRLHAILREN